MEGECQRRGAISDVRQAALDGLPFERQDDDITEALGSLHLEFDPIDWRAENRSQTIGVPSGDITESHSTTVAMRMVGRWKKLSSSCTTWSGITVVVM